MENKFFLQNCVEKIESGKSSLFLNPSEKSTVTALLKKRNIPYECYIPYEGAEKTLIYNGHFPDLEFLEIVSANPLSHRQVLGTLFSHQISPQFYSDILITDRCYIVALSSVAIYLKSQVREIAGEKVSILKSDGHFLKDYKPQYESFVLHVSSLRLDNIISKLSKKSRQETEQLLSHKEIFLNYEIATKKNTVLKEGDIFSIHRLGKYCFKEVLYCNRKGNMDIRIEKYK